MNWMTSGRHRALKSKRGSNKQQMHFPVKAMAPHQSLQSGDMLRYRSGDLGAPNRGQKAVLPVLNIDESHDIHRLEFATGSVSVTTGIIPPAVATTNKTGSEKGYTSSNGPMFMTPISENFVEERCVFTPPKIKSQRCRVSQPSTRRYKPKTPPSEQPLLLFNEGESLTLVDKQDLEVATTHDKSYLGSVVVSCDASPMKKLFKMEHTYKRSQSSGRMSSVHEQGPIHTTVEDNTHEQQQIIQQIAENRSFAHMAQGSVSFSAKHAHQHTDTSLSPFAITDYIESPQAPRTSPISKGPLNPVESNQVYSNSVAPELHISSGSVSSQDSLILPPPVNWQLQAFGKQCIEKNTSVSRNFHADPSTISFRNFNDSRKNTPVVMPVTGVWSMAPRTRSILDQVATRQQERSKVTTASSLGDKFAEATSTAIFLFTLVQCYQIEDQLRSEFALKRVKGHSDETISIKKFKQY